jgi:hypothetical protein
LGAVLATALLGCGRHAVRATEKEYLADRVMAFDEDGQESKAEDSVLDSREGSTGTETSTGGGRGCN